MNAKLLTILVGAALILPVAYAAHGNDTMNNEVRFGDCSGRTDANPDPNNNYNNAWDCTQSPSGDPFPPDLVTGHTVYASWVMERNITQLRDANRTLGLPTDFAAIAGYFAFEDRFAVRDEAARAIQRECVVWFNGMNLDQRPQDDNFGPENSFPSDEDEARNGTGDESYQDYDFDRDVPNCEPLFEQGSGNGGDERLGHAGYAVAVEKGDCNPASGSEFKFRGHLDFVDPNGIYHEVQEYDYVCSNSFLPGLGLGSPPELSAAGISVNEPSEAVSGTVSDFFPETYSDEHNFDGCDLHDFGATNGDGVFVDLGHKCNGTLRDLFTERLWITPLHEEVFDPTIEAVYNFALQIDTCAGINIYELGGKDANGTHNDFRNAERMPGGPVDIPEVGSPNPATMYHDVAYHTWYGMGLDEFTGGNYPLFDVCTDGSSFSFNDTPRGRVVHSGPPQGTGDEEIMRGNSYDFDRDSETFAKHRTNCRVNDINWPMNTYPDDEQVGEDCYPEDHKTAQVDIYVFPEDPTGFWNMHSKGNLTGPDATYEGPGTPTGPDGNPDPRN